jgi:hypothetical protein
MTDIQTYTAFAQGRCITSGSQAEVAAVLRQLPAEVSALFVFDDQTGSPIDLDLREAPTSMAAKTPSSQAKAGQTAAHAEAGAPNSGKLGNSPDEPADKAQAGAERTPRSVGRPKLGVVAREVTLLPRHWDWLNLQPGGASVALRKLVEEARRVNAGRDAARAAREVAYRVMSAIAGHEAGFEEASRALFAGDGARFAEHTAAWPPDVRTYLNGLAAPSWQAVCADTPGGAA